MRSLGRLLAPLALPALLALPIAGAHAGPQSAWPERLQAELAWVDAQHRAELGVYVRDLGTGLSASHRADETWYLASMVKLPVAIAVLRGVERGDWSMQTTLTLRTDDIVDGAGATNHHAIGSPLSVAFLLDQMLIHSDNTASDMLIGLVGIEQVNAVAQSLVPEGLERITSLADVRRHTYSQLAPAAMSLQGPHFLQLRQQRSDADRLALLRLLVDAPAGPLRLPSLWAAYGAYYASGLNSGRLDAYGQLLALLAYGKALEPAGTAYLQDTLERVETGQRRLKAGLPASVRFAHKTGTQRARACDAGLVTVAGEDRRIVVVACARGEPSLVRAEEALRAVGEAIGRSGVLSVEDKP